jgi:hypothetical protein
MLRESSIARQTRRPVYSLEAVRPVLLTPLLVISPPRRRVASGCCRGHKLSIQYLHLSAFSCDNCRGPVVSGWLAVRESEVSKETDVRQVGAAYRAAIGKAK